MATQVDLGKIRPVWKGDWAASTAYEQNDMVKEGVDSYICTTAHTSGSTFADTNWDILALGAEIPAQSGNSGKVLKTDGTDLEWGDVTSILLASYNNVINGDNDRENFTASQVMTGGNDFWIVGGSSPIANPLVKLSFLIPYSFNLTWTQCAVKWYYRVNGGSFNAVTSDIFDVTSLSWGNTTPGGNNLAGIMMHEPSLSAGDTIEYRPAFDANGSSNSVTVPSHGTYNSGSAYAYLNLEILDNTLSEVTYG